MGDFFQIFVAFFRKPELYLIEVQIVSPCSFLANTQLIEQNGTFNRPLITLFPILELLKHILFTISLSK